MRNNALTVLIKAFVDSFRPQMLALTCVAVGVSVLFWIFLVWFSLGPLSELAVYLLGAMGVEVDVYPEAQSTLAGFARSVLTPMLVFGLMWPFVATLAVLLASLYATPLVVKYLGQREFAHLEKKGNAGFVRGVWVACKSVVIFLVVWILTLPLWLIPGVAFLMPILLTAYLLMTVMRFDALATHASVDEINRMTQRDTGSSWFIGLVCAFLSFIPPVLLIMPVMSALAFTRHYLQVLDEERIRRVKI